TKECFWGPFQRSIILPKNANAKEINASFKNNVLEIKIPKTTEEKTKVVKIHVDT
ncbi:Hsp20/alpha crystallin family protein, partial [Candidatus Peregrinibacteria bacterium]|nr:Hsp20/alpha crystallin family protein [Candidatus Peregrinibacteria bacterium]